MLLHLLYDEFYFGLVLYPEETFMVTRMRVTLMGIEAYDTFKIIMN